MTIESHISIKFEYIENISTDPPFKLKLTKGSSFMKTFKSNLSSLCIEV